MRLRLSVLLACLACGATSVAWAQVMTSTSGRASRHVLWLQGISPRNGRSGPSWVRVRCYTRPWCRYWLRQQRLLRALLSARRRCRACHACSRHQQRGARWNRARWVVLRPGCQPDLPRVPLGRRRGSKDARLQPRSRRPAEAVVQTDAQSIVSDNFNRARIRPIRRPQRSSPTIATLPRSSSRSAGGGRSRFCAGNNSSICTRPPGTNRHNMGTRAFWIFLAWLPRTALFVAGCPGRCHLSEVR